jgi:hypothetical protein
VDSVVPTASSKVYIPAGRSVTVNVNTAVAKDIVVHGELIFPATGTTQLTVDTITLIGAGKLTRTTRSSGGAKIIFRNTTYDSTRAAFDPKAFGIGILALETSRIQWDGTVKTPFARSTAAPSAGNTTIAVTAIPSDWVDGDRLLIPDSRQLTTSEFNASPFVGKWEYRTMNSHAGTTITLNSALTHTHPGGREVDGTTVSTIPAGYFRAGEKLLPHVINLTRDDNWESQSADGVRGHTFFTDRARVHLNGISFNSLGRTTIQALSSTNQVGRYPTHFHHCDGDPALPDPTYQGSIVGCAFNNGEGADREEKWGVTVHESHWILIKDNVFNNCAGASVMFEDGAEYECVVEGNISGRHNGTGGRLVNSLTNGKPGSNGTAFYFRGCLSRIRKNIAVGYHDLDTYGYCHFQQDGSSHKVDVPNFRGANMRRQLTITAATNASPIAVTVSTAHGWTTGKTIGISSVTGGAAAGLNKNHVITVTGTTTFTLDGSTGTGTYSGTAGRAQEFQDGIELYAQPILECTDNEHYGGNGAYAPWWVGCDGSGTLHATATSTVSKWVWWNFYTIGSFVYPVNRFTFDGVFARGDINVKGGSTPAGIDPDDYRCTDLLYKNLDIRGMHLGIALSPYVLSGLTTPGQCEVKDSTFDNLTDIRMPNTRSNSYNGKAHLLPAKLSISRNNKHLRAWGIGGHLDIKAALNTGSGVVRTFITEHTMQVIDHNQVPGDNFFVHSPEEDDATVVIASVKDGTTGYDVYGAHDNSNPTVPISGMTNGTYRSTYGRSINGKPAMVSPTTDSFIDGYKSSS